MSEANQLTSNNSVKTEDYIQSIKDSLKALNPYKVILFGSYGGGMPRKDSDIDLLVVTNDDFYPKNYQEHIQCYLQVALHLKEIRKEIPIDLIVHTKPMHSRFIELASQFSKEILQKGTILYESHH